MSKLQPILLGLQASEREIAQLLPQIMQVPFFDQVETDNRSWGWSSNGHGLVPEDFLACGHIRLGLPIDTAIYHLLNRHCAKGARQAEEVIQSSQTIEYMKSLGNHLIPALICSATVLSSPSPPLHENRFPVENFLTADRDEEMCLPLCNGHRQSKRHNSTDSGVLSDHATAEGHLNHLQPPRTFSKSRDAVSNSSLATCESKSDCRSAQSSSASLSYSPMSSTSALPMVHSQSGGDIGAGGDRIKTIVEEVPNREAESRDVTSSSPPRSSHRRRKMSQIHRPSLTSISGSEISDDGTSGNSSIMKGRLIFDRNQWNTTVVDNNMIVAMYGDTTYPLLMWNPKLKLDFEISSSAGVPGMIVAVDPSTPSLNIRLHNPTSHRIAFSIRAYRQTSVHDSHIIYPLNGLHVLEHSQCWEENADIHLDSPDKNEYVIVELFFATLEANKPCWNVVRKYAVMKAKKR